MRDNDVNESLSTMVELMELYAPVNRNVAIGEVVYSAKEVDELLRWARRNAGAVRTLAKRYSSVSTHEIDASLKAWGIRNR